MVSDAQKKVIKDTWAGIDMQKAGDGFYSHMEKDANNVYKVFNFGGDKGKEAAQALKTMQFLDIAVKNIDDLGAVKAKIGPLAQRHTGYGAMKAHFPPAGPCLLAGLADACAGKWSGEAKDAWAAFYNFIAGELSAPLP